MRKLSLFGSLCFLLFVSAVYGMTLECFDDGSIKVDDMSKKWPVSAKEKQGEGKGEGWFEVPGKYIDKSKTVGGKKIPKYVFYSDEALLVSQKGAKYSVKVGKYTRTLSCPPFTFSCRIFNMSVDYCYNRDGLFMAKFMVYNFYFDETNVLRFTSPFMLWYEVLTKSRRRLVHAEDRYSPDFKELNMTMRKLNTGSKFVLRWPTEERVKEFFIRYNNCRQERYNFYERTECTEAAACTIDRDCFDDENCKDGLCEKLDCGECQYITNQSCFNYGCCLNDDCGFEEKCVEHKCEKIDCAFGEAVGNHSCVRLECAEDEKVEEHACVKLDCAGEERAGNHTCLRLECSDDEFPFEHQCLKLKCKGWEKATGHQCVNYFKYVYRKLFKE